jgi:C-terminal processing protease CtpA/Prc
MLARSMQIHKRATVIGDRSSGNVNSAHFFWEPPGQAHGSLFAWEAVEFGTEIAVGKVVMENGEVLEGRGVTPDEYCIPTAADLHAEKDPCLEEALARARAASAAVR